VAGKESSVSQKFLSHFGTPGMRWGVIRANQKGTVYKSKTTKQLEAKLEKVKETAKELDRIIDYHGTKGQAIVVDKTTISALKSRMAIQKVSDKLKRSQQLDNLEQKLTKGTNPGKEFMMNMVFSNKSVYARKLNEVYRLNNTTEAQAVAEFYVTFLPLTGKLPLKLAEKRYINKGAPERTFNPQTFWNND
jgi:hypothetical protein